MAREEAVRFTLTAEERVFVETLLNQAQFQGDLVQAQQWKKFQEEALAILAAPEGSKAGRQVTCSVELAEFIGLSVQNTSYGGNLQSIAKLVDTAVPIIDKLNRALAPIQRRRQREQEKAEAAARKQQEAAASKSE